MKQSHNFKFPGSATARDEPNRPQNETDWSWTCTAQSFISRDDPRRPEIRGVDEVFHFCERFYSKEGRRRARCVCLLPESSRWPQFGPVPQHINRRKAYLIPHLKKCEAIPTARIEEVAEVIRLAQGTSTLITPERFDRWSSAIPD